MEHIHAGPVRESGPGAGDRAQSGVQLLQLRCVERMDHGYHAEKRRYADAQLQLCDLAGQSARWEQSATEWNEFAGCQAKLLVT